MGFSFEFHLSTSIFHSQLLHKRSGALAEDGFLDAVRVAEVKDEDGYVVVEAEGKGGGVHDVEALAQGVEVGKRGVLFGIGKFLGVFVVNTVHLRGLHQNLGAEFGGA